MADEKVYMINLRDAFEKPRGKRGPKAIDIIRAFMARHMKADLGNVKISGKLNEVVWARGIQKPPRRVKIKAIRDGPIVTIYHIDEKIEKKEKKAEAKEKKKETPETEKKGGDSESKGKAEKAAQKLASNRAEASAKKEEKDDRQE
jgi:large subunit ribosomal protein L31e